MTKARKVLVLDHQFAVAQLLATAFRAKQWEVFFATEADFALSVAERGKPDAIVLNSQLTGGGLLALQELRASVQTANIPVFAITDPLKKDRQDLLDAGAQGCFEPPADPAMILAAIEKLVPPSLQVVQAPPRIIGNLERLRALANTGLLDSQPDPTFDELTSLTALLVGVPTVLMSLVDDHRQFFKSQFGLGEPWPSKHETPLSHSFCQWVVSENKELLVFDAQDHPVLSRNGAVRDLGVRAYAGMPLSALPNKTIGSFCAIDSKPHTWTENEVATIEDMAQIANAFIILKQGDEIVDDTGTPTLTITPSMRMEAASSVISGVARILNRGGDRLGAEQRKQLKRMIKQQSEVLLRFAAEAA